MTPSVNAGLVRDLTVGDNPLPQLVEGVAVDPGEGTGGAGARVSAGNPMLDAAPFEALHHPARSHDGTGPIVLGVHEGDDVALDVAPLELPSFAEASPGVG